MGGMSATNIPRSSGVVFGWLENTEETDPSAGRLKGDSADLSLTTKLYINNSTPTGLDLSAFIGSMRAGGFIALYQFGNAGNATLFRVIGSPVNNTGWHVIPVIVEHVVGSFDESAIVEFAYIFNGVALKFAHFYQEGNTLVTGITTVNTFENINCSLTGDKLKDFTVSGNTITYTGVAPINLELSLSASIDPAGNNEDIMLLKAFKNGSTALNGRGKAQVSPSSLNEFIGVLSLFTVASLEENDTIDLKVANGSNGSNMTVQEISGVIREIPQ